MVDDVAGKPYVLVSTDGHAGASLLGYRPYLEQRWLSEFDTWAAGFDDDAWSNIDDSEDFQTGASSFMSPVNWDSDLRQQLLEAEGIAAEVLFPNTIQPFYPTGTLAAPAPRTPGEYGRRWAGVRAHNRWLRDFCSQLPGRRLGLAQLFLTDIDDAISEVRWAKEAGLAGILLPPDHHLNMQNLYYRSLDPLWAVCADLEMPVHRHGIVVSSDEDGPQSRPGAHALGVFESLYFGQRPLAEMVLSGAFERHPRLTFVFTEVGGAAWVLQMLAQLDGMVRNARQQGTIRNLLCGEAAAALSMLPSDYFKRSCYVSTLFSGQDVRKRDAVGMDKMLWGADFPHHEGTAGYTTEWLRASMHDLPETDVRAVTSLNAAQVYDIDLGLLQAVADRIGPKVETVSTPLGVAEVPADPNFLAVFPELTGLLGASR